MISVAVSRRNLARAACALVGAVSLPGPASAGALAGQNLTNEEVVRKWYAAWDKKDWGPVDSLLADDFTFTSAAGDDHISKSTFKARCWETQINFIAHFDLERVITGADDAFVKYLCHTKNGKSFRNVEYLRIKNGKLQSIECYFGAQSSFPSAVSTAQKYPTHPAEACTRQSHFGQQEGETRAKGFYHEPPRDSGS
jgi:ketosteroid isomerase-like protein